MLCGIWLQVSSKSVLHGRSPTARLAKELHIIIRLVWHFRTLRDSCRETAGVAMGRGTGVLCVIYCVSGSPSSGDPNKQNPSQKKVLIMLIPQMLGLPVPGRPVRWGLSVYPTRNQETPRDTLDPRLVSPKL